MVARGGSPRTLILVALLLGVRVAAASPAEDTRGKNEYDRALKYYAAEEHEAALPLFQRAYELSNHRPSTVLGLAQCERALKMYDRALEHYREFLRINPKSSDVASVKETIAMIEEVRDDARRKESPQPEKRPSADRDAAPRQDELRLAAPSRTATRAAMLAPPPALSAKEDSTGVFSSPYFWVAAVGVVVLGGAAVFVATKPSHPEPYSGTTGLFFKP